MKLIFFVESYVAGGSDRIANILLQNLNFKEIVLIINKRSDTKLILKNIFDNKVKVVKYSLITPAEIHNFINKFKNFKLSYFLIKIISQFFLYPLLLFSVFYFYLLFKRFKASHFYSHNGGHPGGLFNGTALIAATFISDIKYRYYAFHSNPTKYRLYLIFFDYIWDRIIDKSSKIITISLEASKNLKKFRFFKKSPTVIYNGLEKNKLKNYSSSKKLRILNVGYFDKNKNQILLLKSLKLLIENRKTDIHLTFIGETLDKNEKRNFEKFIINHNLKNYVTIKGFTDNIKPYYYENDLLVCTSFVEGFPLAILEAMSVGLPIISTKAGGTIEQVDDGINGFLVEINNPEILSLKIKYFIDNKNEIMKMGKSSFKKFNSKFEINRMVDNYNSLIKDKQ